ncbi:hypothetical protein [Pyrodictium occultum]|nr:hypothetical protein [Pyrodictium occultum]
MPPAALVAALAALALFSAAALVEDEQPAPGLYTPSESHYLYMDELA